MSFFEVLLFNPLLQSAMIAALLASIASGIIGSYVVVKRIVFISGSIAHSVLGGIGFFIYLNRVYNISWATPLLGAVIAAIFSACLISWIRLYYHEREDSVIAALWSLGMALGILFISQTPGYNLELTNFLVGNILWISPENLWVLLGLDLMMIVVVFFMHERFLAICFDEEQARLQGVPVKIVYTLLLILIAISVVILIQVVGIILVLTLLTIPAAIANFITIRLTYMMIFASLFAILFSFLGTALAFHLDWPTGATIALTSAIAYILSLFVLRKREKV